MTNIIDSLDLLYEILTGISIPIFIQKAPVGISENHVVLNAIPQNRLQVISNNICNVNLYVKKIGEIPDSNTALSLLDTIYGKLETLPLSSSNARIKYFNVNIEGEASYFDEDENFGFYNTRVTISINNSKI